MESFRPCSAIASPIKRRRRAVAARGFTLFEILVVLIIILTVTMIVLNSESAFNKTLILKNTAYDIALAMRSAQSLGLGTRRSVSAVTNVGYGVSFSIDNNTSFKIFPDTDPPSNSSCHGLPSDRGNNQDAASAPDALFGDCSFIQSQDTPYQTMTLGNGVRITGLCVYTTSWSCRNVSGFGSAPATSPRHLDIVFSRPNSEPMFASTNAPGGPTQYSQVISKACIKISSPEGGTRAIKIESSGLINPNAPTSNTSQC